METKSCKMSHLRKNFHGLVLFEWLEPFLIPYIRQCIHVNLFHHDNQ